jgi:hypothetical protein
VARLQKVPFQVNCFIPKGRLGFGLRGLKGTDQIVLLVDDPHPPAATAGRGLDDDGEADLTCGL